MPYVGSVLGTGIPLFDTSTPDAGLDAVVTYIRAMDPDGSRIGRVLRSTLDQLYDGGRTGRFRWQELFKTEKTHCGTLVEINLQREFVFADGAKLDFEIAGHEVDAKYSQAIGGWMLPPEAVGELCLLVHADDARSEFSVGVVRASEDHLNKGSNRDAKRTLNAFGRDSIRWLQSRAPLPPNILLHLPSTDQAAIMSCRPGQSQITELLRRVHGTVISRVTIETLGRQKDPMKRVRGNGGARQHLGPEGILILVGDWRAQRQAAQDLGLPVPGEGEVVATYVARALPGWDGPTVLINDEAWRRASKHDAEPFAAPWYGWFHSPKVRPASSP